MILGASFQQVFRNITDVRWKEADFTTELDRPPGCSSSSTSTAWENDNALEAQIEEKIHLHTRSRGTLDEE